MEEKKQVAIPEENQPISMWGYFGYEILFSIPIVGWILIIVYSFSSKNVNLKNYARSYFCMWILLLILIILLGVVTGGTYVVNS